MIQSIRLGQLWGVPAVIELVDKDSILLERVQTEPHYHNETLEFNLKGALLIIDRVEDIVIGEMQKDYDRSKLGIRLNHKNGTISCIYDKQLPGTVKHAIENTYNNDAKEFLELLKNTKVSEKQKPLKNKMLGLLKIISSHDFAQYLLYKIE